MAYLGNTPDGIADAVINIPAGNIEGVTVQQAVNELDAEKQAAAIKLTNFASLDSTLGLVEQNSADGFTKRVIGTAAEGIPTNNVVNNTTRSFTGAQRGNVTILTSAAGAVAINLAANNNFSHSTIENTTLSLPTNPVAGQSGIITITQGVTPYQLTYNPFWRFANGGFVPLLTLTAGAVDVFAYYVNDAGFATCSLIKNVKAP